MTDEDCHRAGVSAVLLFGSRARGDNSRGSDTDLLLVSPPGNPRHKSIGHLSMFFYPWPKLVTDARDGDLFVCHLACEAKPIFDPSDRLEALRATFELRSSYRREICHASDLGWLIDRHAEALAAGMIARRIIWCVRTILIARSAERGAPVFAPAELATTTSSTSAAELLVERHQRKADALMRRRFRRFLAEEASPPPLSSEANLGEYGAYFQQTENAVALRMLRARRADEAEYV